MTVDCNKGNFALGAEKKKEKKKRKGINLPRTNFILSQILTRSYLYFHIVWYSFLWRGVRSSKIATVDE